MCFQYLRSYLYRYGSYNHCDVQDRFHNLRVLSGLLTSADMSVSGQLWLWEIKNWSLLKTYSNSCLYGNRSRKSNFKNAWYSIISILRWIHVYWNILLVHSGYELGWFRFKQCFCGNLCRTTSSKLSANHLERSAILTTKKSHYKIHHIVPEMLTENEIKTYPAGNGVDFVIKLPT